MRNACILSGPRTAKARNFLTLPAVEAAGAEALAGSVHSADVVSQHSGAAVAPKPPREPRRIALSYASPHEKERSLYEGALSSPAASTMAASE